MLLLPPSYCCVCCCVCCGVYLWRDKVSSKGETFTDVGRLTEAIQAKHIHCIGTILRDPASTMEGHETEDF